MTEHDSPTSIMDEKPLSRAGGERGRHDSAVLPHRHPVHGGFYSARVASPARDHGGSAVRHGFVRRAPAAGAGSLNKDPREEAVAAVRNDLWHRADAGGC